jgi:RNA polymerase sigma-70 factor (ECF subfamily)
LETGRTELAIDEGDPTTVGRPVTCERLSTESVRALYAVHGRDLLTFLTGVLRNPDSAQDVCQATFQRLLEVGYEARTETIRGWLFKVAFHEALAFRRRQSRREQVQQRYGESCEFLQPEVSLESLVKAEDVARLKGLLKELPPEQQVVVQQRLGEDKTFAAIAEELKLPLGTVLTRMRLAMQRLRGMFGREDLE